MAKNTVFFACWGLLSLLPIWGQAQACTGQVLSVSATTPSQTGTSSTWTVPSGGPYKVRITAKGGKGGDGGYVGGAGATMIGEFIVTAGQTIEAMAGAPGFSNIETDPSFPVYNGGGGGAGSGARISGITSPMLIAGGGGGASNRSNGLAGQTLSGNGQGGSARAGAGGGGLFSNGADAYDQGAISQGGGAGFGGLGGIRGYHDGSHGGGGYGGGGGSISNGGGGGGGYSGGIGGRVFISAGGGGSLNLGANQNNTSGSNNAGGQVIIECLGTATFAANFTPIQPNNCALPYSGGLNIDFTGDLNGNPQALEYAIASGGGGFPSNPVYFDVTSDPFDLPANGPGTFATPGGTTHTIRVRLKYNPSMYMDYTYTLIDRSGTIYVKSNASGANNGTSWANAFTDLQSALAVACEGAQIWVAAGTYKPTSGTDRNISFVMKNGVKILGGFPNNNNNAGLGDRNWVANTTILSAEIGAAGKGDNSYHVILNNDNGLNSSAVLDGFTVTGGNADVDNFLNGNGGGMFNYISSPSVANCTFSGNSVDNYGGGVFNLSNTANFTNCSFSGNTANGGGGLYVNISTAALTNCTFSNNKAGIGSFGGGVYCGGNTAVNATNCTFFGNTGGASAGFFKPFNSTATLTNCIVWGNSSGISNDISVNNSIIQGGYSGAFNLDPRFEDAANGNFRLQTCSPAIDAGLDVANSTSTDLDGNTRKFEAIAGGQMIDMGAYEYQQTAPMPTALCKTTHTVVLSSTSASITPADINDGSIDNNCGSITLASINGQSSVTYTCSDIGLHTATLTVYATQSNRTATCQTMVTVLDNTPPTAVCQNITVNLSGNSVGIAPEQVFNATLSSDICGTVLPQSVSPNTIGMNALGANTVVLTVHDGHGNTGSCAATVQVNGSIAGRIIWKQDQNTGVKDVTVALSGDQNGSMTTATNGNYNFPLSNGGNFTITPAKNLNKMNGINAQDVQRIQQHLSGNPISDPWQMLAADVNVSNGITALDANILQLAILGNPSALAQMLKSWRFVPTSYALSNPPWGCPEQVSVSSIGTNFDFYGVKVGDVAAAHANPANAGAPPLLLTAQDQLLQAGNHLTVELTAGALRDLNALQFALHFDPEHLQLSGVESLGALPLNNEHLGTWQASEGSLRVLWSDAQGQGLTAGAPLLRLHFAVLEGGTRLSEVLQLDDAVLPGLVFTGAGASAGVTLRYDAATAAQQPVAAGLSLENYPNPCIGYTTIRFELPQACDAQLRIADATGRVVTERTKQYAAGRYEERFDLQGLSGTLYYELSTPSGVMVRKMVVLTE